MPLKQYEEESSQPLRGVRNVIAVAAGKGGVGKSAVAVNLALALRQLGHRVGIMDADVYGPSVRRMLPEDRAPVQRGEKIEPALALGVRLMSMAYFSRDGQAAAVRAPIANNVVRQFLHQVVWGELDFLLVDFPPGTGDVQLTLAQHARLNGAVIVTTPQELALLDVRKAIDLFEKVRIPILGVLENMSFYEHRDGERIHLFGRGGGERLAREKGVPLLGKVPIDPELCHYSDRGFSLFHRPDGCSSSTADAFLEVAGRLEDQLALIESEGETGFVLNWKEMQG